MNQLALPVILPRQPATRGECVDGPRPCLCVTCRFHLARDIVDSGRTTLRWVNVGDMPETCSLDVADTGEHTLDEIAAYMNVARQHVGQLEAMAVEKFRRNWRAMYGTECPV